MGTINGRDGDKAAEAAMLQFSRFLDQLPFFRCEVRKHLRSQCFLAGAPRRNVILFGHRSIMVALHQIMALIVLLGIGIADQ